MGKRMILPGLALVAAAALAGCEADQEALEEGVDLDAPAEIENAPLVDTVGPEGLGDDLDVGAPESGGATGGVPGSDTGRDTVF